jgi:hypothetical protein
VLGQGADTQLDRTQLVEVLGELIRGDADETRRESALRHESPGGTARDAAHRLGDFDVFGEIEIVRVTLARRLGHDGIAVIRQAGDDGVRFMQPEVVVERPGVAGIHGHGTQVARAMCLDHGFGRGRVDIAQRDVVIAGFGQKPTDEGADLAGTQDQHFVHENLVGAVVCRNLLN